MNDWLTTRNLTSLIVGDRYSNEEIFTSLKVGNAGGLRFSLTHGNIKRAVVMTSLGPSRKLLENPYHDRREGDILIYTAAGREGDQTLSGLNKRIPEQIDSKFPVHGFSLIANRKDKRVGPDRWEYLGLLEYLRHFPDTQIDSRGALRKVWVFEFRVHPLAQPIPLVQDATLSRQILEESQKRELPTFDDRRTIAAVHTPPSLSLGIDPIKVEKVRASLLTVAPVRFEHLLKQLLLISGFSSVQVTKYSQDGGIDVNAHLTRWALGNLHLQIQAKRWIHTVGRKEVAELRGSLQPFACGTLITTSYFSKAALAEATNVGKIPIHLVNGYELATVIIEHNAQSLYLDSSP